MSAALRRVSHDHFAFFLQYFIVAVAQSLPVAAMALILQIDLDGRAYPEQVNTFYANVLLLPAFFKPLPGGLSDWLQLRGTGRGRFLVVIEILWAAALLEVANSRSRESYFVFFALIAMCCGAVEAVLDGASVELMHALELSGAEVQSTAYAFKTAGSLVAYAVSPALLAIFGSHYTVVKVCAFVPLLAIPASCPSFPATPRAAAPCEARLTRGAAFGALFLFLRASVPTEADTYASFVSTKVSGVWVAVRYTSSQIGSLVALFAFQALPQKVTRSLRLTVLVTTVLAVLVGAALQLFLVTTDCSSPWMYALFGALLGAVDSLAFLPNLAVCADCAPKECGALGFAFLSLILDLGDQVASRLAAGLTKAYHIGTGQDRSWQHLGNMVLLCRLASLLPLLLLPGFRTVASRQEAEAVETAST